MLGLDSEAQAAQDTPIFEAGYRFLHTVVQEEAGIESSLVGLSRRVHAESYHKEKFVFPSAINEDGELHPDIDHARAECGFRVYHYIAEDPDSPESPLYATMRKVLIDNNDAVESLPVFQLAKDGLNEGVIDQLEQDRDMGRTVVEIAALARSPMINLDAFDEIFKRAILDGVDRDEIWVMSLVKNTYGYLSGSLGQDNFQVIGEAISIDDERVNPGVDLIPSRFDPGRFHQRLLDAYYEAIAEDSSLSRQRRLFANFMFHTDGVDPQLLTQEVINARADLEWRSRSAS